MKPACMPNQCIKRGYYLILILFNTMQFSATFFTLISVALAGTRIDRPGCTLRYTQSCSAYSCNPGYKCLLVDHPNVPDPDCKMPKCVPVSSCPVCSSKACIDGKRCEVRDRTAKNCGSIGLVTC